jgi:hypothetical protein
MAAKWHYYAVGQYSVVFRSRHPRTGSGVQPGLKIWIPTFMGITGAALNMTMNLGTRVLG